MMINKISMKLLNITIIFGMLLINLFIPSNVLAEYKKGDIKDSVITVGENSNDGDILITKTIEKVDNDGEYKVIFDINGKDVKQEIENQKNSYTVFVLDASLSMMGIKWTKAKEAAINFSKTLVEDSNKNYIALVTFNGKGYQLRNFQNEVFDSNLFGNINYYTNYYEGLSKAYDYLISINDDGVKNIVFISDGEPNNDNYDDILKTIKDDDINIYSLAYELDSDSKAYDKLLNISTNNQVYEVNSDDIDEKLFTVANEIIKVNAGSQGILTDNIGEHFNYVSGDVLVNGKKVTINVGDITEDNKKFTFNIKLDDDLDTDWYPTNNGFTLNYIDSNNQKKVLSTDESASVYWVSDKVNLTINYYHNNEQFKSVQKIMKKGTNINDEVLDIDSNMNTGYTLDSISQNNFQIDNDTIINIYYKKIDDLNYLVNYYQDNELIDKKEYHNIEYGSLPHYDDLDIKGYSVCVINNNTNPIIDNDTIIDVYYCKNDYPYQVKYYYDNKLDSTQEYIAQYNDIITNYDNRIKEGYIIDKIDTIPFTVTDNISNNIINIYYQLKDISYQVHYLDKDGNKLIKDKLVTGKYYDIIDEAYENIDNYQITSDEIVPVKLDDNTQDIKFIYELKPGMVTICYVDEEGNKISDDTVIKGNYGDNYSMIAKDIDNYQYQQDKELEGIIDEDNKVIKLQYKKIELKDVFAPLTGISYKYFYLFLMSLIGLLSLIIIKKVYNAKK
ncbi:MAG: VWA domain-containing protein [Bacilli bacterium]|nr:VWA domain-containing protein [Bacilli bacterium]